MTLDEHPPTATAWDTEPDAVRAVLDLAFARGGDLHSEIVDRITAALVPDHADVIADIAVDLHLAEEYDCGRLDPVVGLLEAERLVHQHRADAIRAARLVASLLPTPRETRALRSVGS